MNLLQKINESRGTAFQKAVWRAIANIPTGTTITYKQLAESIGKPRACRAVANACGANPFPLEIPCHRVVASGGNLGGFSLEGGVNQKRALLIKEQAFPLKQSSAVACSKFKHRTAVDTP